jgi:hypothetical protein
MAYPATVELTNTLPDVVLSGNKIPLKFQASENFLASTGCKSEIILTWSAVAVADEYFDLLLAGETVRFTCKAAPDNSGIQFHDNSGAGTLNGWVALLANDLKANYIIARYYDLVIVDNVITITAKTEGTDYSQEFTAGAGIDCVATETDKAGIDRTVRAFYAIVLLLYCNDKLITELLLNIDDEGLAETDVSEYLKAYLSQDFQWPESDAEFIYARTGAIKSWYFRYGEKWGDDDYRSLILSSTYYVMYGGVSWMQQAKYNSDVSSFWAKLQYNQYFLSWAPLTRYIGPAEPVKLYFINHSAATTLKLKAKLYTASTNSTSTVDSVAGIADKAMYEFILSPAKVNYAGLSTETLVKIEVWMDNESDVRVSEIRTFYLDYSHYEHTRYFIFRNSLGAFEIIRTTGLMTRKEDYSREVAAMDPDSDYTSKDREEISVLNKEQQKFNVALGWLKRYASADEFRNWLRDFTLSKEVYQAIGNTLKPVRLTGSSFDHGKDRDMLQSFSFDFTNAFTDEHFTKELTWNLFDESYASDFEKAQ